MLNYLAYPAFLRPLASVILAVVSLFLSVFDLPTVPYGKTVNMDRFELVWADEFNGDSLDTTVWKQSGRVSQSTLRRGGYWNTDMARVHDGDLHIVTEYYPDGYNGNGKPGWYTAGIDTQDSFTQCYGYYEVRCILPEGYGLWSAFWMMNHGVGTIGDEGRDGTEIDIFESAYFSEKGLKKNSVSSNLHFDGYGEAHQQRNVCHTLLTANNPYKEYNTYGLEWNEDGYTFYVNGVKTGKSDFGGVSRNPEWLLLSVEVGGDNAVPGESWAGPSIETDTSLVSDFVVDYVRVYQYK